jgi:hypothetical protein
LKRRGAVPALIFAVALVVFAISPVKVQTDSVWSIPTVVSLLHEGNADLDEFRPTTDDSPHGLVTSHGHVYSGFPLGPSLAALPLIGAFDGFVRLTAPLAEKFPRLKVASERWRTRFHAVGKVELIFYDTIELIVASLFVAGATVLVFLTGRQVTTMRAALIVTAVFAFGTSAYSTASRVLWQHSPSILAIAAVVFVLTRPAKTWKTAAAAGLLAAIAFTLRPTNAITILAVAGYFAATRPKWLVPFALAGLGVAVPFCLYHWSVFDSVLPAYYLPQRLEPGEGHFAQALVGNLVSPGRGLFVYTPVLMFCFFARPRGIEWALVGIVVAHWLAISAFPHWWAGHSFGPRLFTDVVPYFVYFLFRPVELVLSNFRQRPKWTVLLGLAAALSLFIHTRGATSIATHGWNGGPPDVDVAPQRVWDWKDLAFLRGLGDGR